MSKRTTRSSNSDRPASPGRRLLLHGMSMGVLAGGLLPLKARAAERADRVRVVKSQRRLYLLKGDRKIREFPVSLGLEPSGHKRHEGDFRTPEGSYLLVDRNFDSDFFLSIQISYPNEEDLLHAREQGVDPGSYIMIHGLPNRLDRPLSYYETRDWTNGCIAVNNAHMVEIWMLTDYMTPIEILA